MPQLSFYKTQCAFASIRRNGSLISPYYILCLFALIGVIFLFASFLFIFDFENGFRLCCTSTVLVCLFPYIPICDAHKCMDTINFVRQYYRDVLVLRIHVRERTHTHAQHQIRTHTETNERLQPYTKHSEYGKQYFSVLSVYFICFAFIHRLRCACNFSFELD